MGSRLSSLRRSVNTLVGKSLPCVGVHVYNQRMSICKQCRYFSPTLKRCSKCGCFMVVKARLQFTRCPEGKWLAYAQ